MTENARHKSPSPAVLIRNYEPGDRDWVVSSHVQHYVNELGFDDTFLDVLLNALKMLESGIDDYGSRFLIAETGQDRIGSIFFSRESAGVGRIRLFFLAHDYRQRGIGRKLLAEVIRFARQNTFERIHVSTYDIHSGACKLYQRNGFKILNQQPVNAFGRTMTQLNFDLAL